MEGTADQDLVQHGGQQPVGERGPLRGGHGRQLVAGPAHRRADHPFLDQDGVGAEVIEDRRIRTQLSGGSAPATAATLSASIR
jgi:hypothetical protein